jgi:hypothetical protein
MTDPVILPLDQFEALLARAAEEGARKALERVGLCDEHAASDIQTLRGLLDAWRDARTESLRTVSRVLTVAALGALAAWAGLRLHFGD